jgi:hypothetical protein
VVDPPKDYEEIAEAVHCMSMPRLGGSPFGIYSLPSHAIHTHEVDLPQVVEFLVPKSLQDYVSTSEMPPKTYISELMSSAV